MRVRGIFITRVRQFLTDHGLTKSELGTLAVGDRQFLGDVERGKSVTLGRIEQVEELIERIEAKPSELERCRAEGPQQLEACHRHAVEAATDTVTRTDSGFGPETGAPALAAVPLPDLGGR